jgi:hypothetical protein
MIRDPGNPANDMGKNNFSLPFTPLLFLPLFLVERDLSTLRPLCPSVSIGNEEVAPLEDRAEENRAVPT